MDQNDQECVENQTLMQQMLAKCEAQQKLVKEDLVNNVDRVKNCIDGVAQERGAALDCANEEKERLSKTLQDTKATYQKDLEELAEAEQKENELGERVKRLKKDAGRAVQIINRKNGERVDALNKDIGVLEGKLNNSSSSYSEVCDYLAELYERKEEMDARQIELNVTRKEREEALRQELNENRTRHAQEMEKLRNDFEQKLNGLEQEQLTIQTELDEVTVANEEEADRYRTLQAALKKGVSLVQKQNMAANDVEISKLRKELDTLKEDCDTMSSQMDECRALEEKYQTEIQELHEAIKSDTENNASLSDDLNKTKEDINHLESEIKRVDAGVAKKQKDIDRLIGEIRHHENKASRTQSETQQKLKTLVDESNNELNRQLMKAKLVLARENRTSHLLISQHSKLVAAQKKTKKEYDDVNEKGESYFQQLISLKNKVKAKKENQMTMIRRLNDQRTAMNNTVKSTKGDSGIVDVLVKRG